ncbi:MAG TPA: class A beta-lactamase [Candidatus Aquilonibacter sp.]
MTNTRDVRRIEFFGGVASLTSLAGIPAIAATNPADALETLERSTGGRLGVFAVETGSGATITHRSDERFAMCGTFTFLLCAAVLARVDRGSEHLDRRVSYTKADLLPNSPFTSALIRQQDFAGVKDLLDAAMDRSDNCAANLLLASIGGPAAVTNYARSIGDTVTRLDRIELALNAAIPDDLRDTTSPAAMAGNLRKLVLMSSPLSDYSHGLLMQLLQSGHLGASRLRAGLPKRWIVGDKTGTGGANNSWGDSNTANDIAVAWRPRGAPIVIAAYLTECRLPAAQREAALATVGRIVADSFNALDSNSQHSRGCFQ